MGTKSVTESTSSVTAEQRYRMIAEAAYFRAEKRHFASADMAQDWIEAEAEIDRQLRSVSGDMVKNLSFEDTLRQQITRWDARLDQLAENAKTARTTAKASIKKQIGEMTANREALKARLNALQTSTALTWDDLKHQTEQILAKMQDAYDHAASQKEVFEQQLTTQLAVWDVRYQNLKARAKNKGVEAQSNLQSKMYALEAHRDAAEAQLAQLRNRSTEAWQDIKTGAENTWKELHDSLDRIADHFK
ncbi:MAG: DUF2934 domain-containing protein [Betaproteobacteria bacterium]|nr:DUF2934 domain-containing protein [Betaproteobacteria bacterium]